MLTKDIGRVLDALREHGGLTIHEAARHARCSRENALEALATLRDAGAAVCTTDGGIKRWSMTDGAKRSPREVAERVGLDMAEVSA